MTETKEEIKNSIINFLHEHGETYLGCRGNCRQGAQR